MPNTLITNRPIKTSVDDAICVFDYFFKRKHLGDLNRYPIIPLQSFETNGKKLRTYSNLRFVKISKFVSDAKNINNKLAAVYNVLHGLTCACVLIIDGNEQGVDFYMGIRSLEKQTRNMESLLKALDGQFPGYDATSLREDKIQSLMERICSAPNSSHLPSISSLSITPSARKGEDKYDQGIEKFIDAQKGRKYTAVIIAEPITSDELSSRKLELHNLATQLSKLKSLSIQTGTNSSNATTDSTSTAITDSINQSIANSVGWFNSNGANTSKGRSSGFGLLGWSWTTSHGSGQSSTSGTTNNTTQTTGDGKAKTYTTQDGKTITIGTSESMTTQQVNSAVEDMLQKIKIQLSRLTEGEAYGLWNCAGYFLSDNGDSAESAAHQYKGLVTGENTGVDGYYVNTWNNSVRTNALGILESIRYCRQPFFNAGEMIFNAGSFVSGKELPIMLGIPYKEVSGVTVTPHADFGRNIYAKSFDSEPGEEIYLGNIYHKGSVDTNRIFLKTKTLCSHCFITGSPRSGKSHTTYSIIDKLYGLQKKFMVIEPAKGEYKSIFGGMPEINIFTTNPRLHRLLKINPFRFPKGISVAEHIDSLIEIFNVCWEMYAAMPAILKDGIVNAYRRVGWDITNSINIKNGPFTYPTFNDLLAELSLIIEESEYSREIKDNYKGAMLTRVKSLTNGINGLIFSSYADIPNEILFDENVIIDLSHVSAPETKSLIMGVLLIKLNEYRMSTSTGEDSPLKHITIIEEAHDILKNTSFDTTAGAGVAQKGVEKINNAIAEMATYGEGFFIVDQSPTAVSDSSIKNTNTKIIFHLPDSQDRAVVGGSVAANERQIDEIARLPRGVAVVRQIGWVEPVLVSIPKWDNPYYKKSKEIPYPLICKARRYLATEIVNQRNQKKYCLSDFEKCANDRISDIGAQKAKDYIQIFKAYESVFSRISNDDGYDYNVFWGNLLCEVLEVSELFELVRLPVYHDDNPKFIKEVNQWYTKVEKQLSTYLDSKIDSKFFKYIIKLLLYWHNYIAQNGISEDVLTCVVKVIGKN